MKKKLLFGITVLSVSALALSACSVGGYNYNKEGIPGLEGSLTLEMGYDEFEKNLDYESIEYYYALDDAKDVPFYTRYSSSVYIDTSSGSEAIPDVTIHFSSSDSDYEDVVNRLTEDLGEPAAGTSLVDDSLVCNYICWGMDNSHAIYAFLTNSGELYVTCALVDEEEKNTYEQCMKNISGNEDLSQAYETMLDHYALLGSSIQLAIDKYGAEWSSSNDYAVYFKESGELLGYPGHYSYNVGNPDNDSFFSDFIGQIERSGVSFTFDERVDIDAVVDDLSEMFGECTVENDDDTGEVQYYRWKEAPFSVSFNPNTLSLIWDLNEVFCVAAPDIITELNEREADRTPVDRELLQLPDFELTGGEVTDLSTREELWDMVQEDVLKDLKSPSSAEFPPLKDVSIQHIGSLYYVESYVESQNSFGAMVKTSFLALLERTDSGFKLTDLEYYD